MIIMMTNNNGISNDNENYNNNQKNHEKHIKSYENKGFTRSIFDIFMAMCHLDIFSGNIDEEDSGTMDGFFRSLDEEYLGSTAGQYFATMDGDYSWNNG